MTKLNDLATLGQAVWLDFVRRSYIDAGHLGRLIDDGLRGVTSNPTIFEQAIGGGADYDADIRRLAAAGRPAPAIYEALALDDIGRAADLLRPVYDATGGGDGFVSLEVDPALAADTAGTIAEARRLFAALGRPNVMIKIPATPQGMPAITAAVGAGINVNVTLIFSLAQYESVVDAYLTGLEQLAQVQADRNDRAGLSTVASVASFFVSRVDTAVDRELARLGRTDLQGRAAVANAKLAYARFEALFAGPRWDRLAALGARVQRPLWASTGTKDPRYPDTLYVDSLIGPNTVNTLPPATLEAFLDHGAVAPTLAAGRDEAAADLARIAEAGVDLDEVTARLLEEGVAAFARSFESLLASLRDKRAELEAA